MISKFFMVENRVTGSEQTPSHKGTKCLDFASDVDGWATAHADCRVVKIDRLANSVWFTTLDYVDTPNGLHVITHRMAHMNDSDYNNLGMKLGKVFKQGEKFYRQGCKGATATHIHCEFGFGQLMGQGWHRLANGNWTIDCTGGSVHVWEAVYLKEGTHINKFNDGLSPQDSYEWQFEPQTTYQTHIQNVGDSPIAKDWQISGTVGESKRLEAIIIHGHCAYRTHCQNIGWSGFVRDTWSGSKGKGLRLEAIEIVADEGYMVEAQAHVSNIGWQPIQTGKQVTIGTVGQSKAIEAVAIKVSMVA